MSSLLLYKLDASPPACAAMILGDLLGLEFQYREPNIMTLEHKSPEYMKMNPMGTIPTLKDGDFVVSDSNAIMVYLLSKYGQDLKESLYPSDVNTRAIIDQCLYFNAGVFFVRLKAVAVPTIYEGLKRPSEKNLKDIETAFRVVEAYLERSQYIAADHFTIADIAVGTTANAMRGFYPLDADKFPLTTAWLARLEGVPSFSKYSVPGAARLATVLKACWEKNNKQ